MFDNNLASFNAFPDFSDAFLLGELTFTHITVPFKKLHIPTKELTQVNMCGDYYNFALPLDDGQLIVTFKWYLKSDDHFDYSTHMSCFERLGRLKATDDFDFRVQRENVAVCGSNEFVVFHKTDDYVLSVYDSGLNC